MLMSLRQPVGIDGVSEAALLAIGRGREKDSLILGNP